jgi:hypothetical protein
VLALVVVFVPAQSARAESQDRESAARSAATSGLKAYQDGRYRQALAFFERAESLTHAPAQLLFVARAQAKLKRLVLARESYKKIVSETLPPTASQAGRDVKAVAQQELVELEPRIPLLKISLNGDEGKPVRVTLDGAEVPSAVIGVSRPVDPGPHELMAVADDRTSPPLKVTLAEGAREAVVLELVPHATSTGPLVPASGLTSEPRPVEPQPVEPQPVDARRDSGGDALRVGGYVALGVGVAGLATGTVFAIRSHNKRSEADDLCGGQTCPVSRRDEIDPLYADARRAENISRAGFVVGGLGAASGIVMLILSGNKEEPARPPSVSQRGDGTTPSQRTVRPVLGLGHVGLAGRF